MTAKKKLCHTKQYSLVWLRCKCGNKWRPLYRCLNHDSCLRIKQNFETPLEFPTNLTTKIIVSLDVFKKFLWITGNCETLTTIKPGHSMWLNLIMYFWKEIFSLGFVTISFYFFCKAKYFRSLSSRFSQYTQKFIFNCRVLFQIPSYNTCVSALLDIHPISLPNLTCEEAVRQANITSRRVQVARSVLLQCEGGSLCFQT